MNNSSIRGSSFQKKNIKKIVIDSDRSLFSPINRNRMIPNGVYTPSLKNTDKQKRLFNKNILKYCTNNTNSGKSSDSSNSKPKNKFIKESFTERVNILKNDRNKTKSTFFNSVNKIKQEDDFAKNTIPVNKIKQYKILSSFSKINNDNNNSNTISNIDSPNNISPFIKKTLSMRNKKIQDNKIMHTIKIEDELMLDFIGEQSPNNISNNNVNNTVGNIISAVKKARMNESRRYSLICKDKIPEILLEYDKIEKDNNNNNKNSRSKNTSKNKINNNVTKNNNNYKKIKKSSHYATINNRASDNIPISSISKLTFISSDDETITTNNNTNTHENNSDKFKTAKIDLRSKAIFKLSKQPKKFFSLNKFDYFVVSESGIDGNNIKLVNQDNYFFFKSLLDLTHFDVFGIIDGHGEDGHFISKLIPSEIKNYFGDEKNYKNTEDFKKYKILDFNFLYNFFIKNKYQFIKTFIDSLEQKLHQVDFDSKLSGCSITFIFRLNDKFIIGSLGLTKCIFVKRDLDNNKKILDQFNIILSTKEHKLSNTEEIERVENTEGVVKIYRKNLSNGGLIYKICEKGCKYPGLTFSRAIGDLGGKHLGVIASPDFYEVDISKYDTEGDKVAYIILGTSGVWKYMNDQEIMNIINPFYIKGDCKGAAGKIVDVAIDKWKNNEEEREDTTCLAYFFK